MSRASNPMVGGLFWNPDLPEISVRGMGVFTIVPPPHVVLPAWSEPPSPILPRAKGGARENHKPPSHPWSQHHVTADVTSASARHCLVSLPHHPLTSSPCQPVLCHVIFLVSSHVTMSYTLLAKWRHADVITKKRIKHQKSQIFIKSRENNRFPSFSLVSSGVLCMSFYVDFLPKLKFSHPSRWRLQIQLRCSPLNLLNHTRRHKTRYLPEISPVNPFFRRFLHFSCLNISIYPNQRYSCT